MTVFGSARFPETHEYYALGREVGRALTGLGFTVMTGGGPGVMEAANRGAQEAGGRSVGCNIMLAHEQFPNRYLDRHVTCHYFFVRKVLLFKYSYAFVVLPGGLGTLDELTEALTLIQTGKILQFPVVLMGVRYWALFTDLLKQMVASGTMSATDLDLFLTTDSVRDAMAHIEHHAIRRFGLTRRKGPPPRRWLWEEALRVQTVKAGLKPGPRSPTQTRDADRAAHAGATVTAVAVRILRQVLLVVRLGVKECRGFRKFGRNRSVARGFEPLLIRRA